MSQKGKAKVSLQIENFQNLIKNIEQYNDRGIKAIQSTVKDMKNGAAGWVATEVTKVYAINKKEIKPGSTGRNKDGTKRQIKQAGNVRVSGDTIENFTMIYRGRMLTPVHFHMTPTTPPKGKSYTIKMQVYKGQKQTIGRYKNTRTPGGPYSQRSHNILMSTGSSKENGIKYIPFQRMSKKRTDLKKFTTVSVPQMVSNETVSKGIYEKLNEMASKRLEHYLNRY